MKVSVVGLGYVGLPTAIAIARAGHEVFGYDINDHTVASLSRGESRLRDSYVDTYLPTSTAVFETEIRSSDAYLICVPTPIDERFDPLPHEQLAPLAVAVDVTLPADRGHARQLGGHLVPEPLHGGPIGTVLLGARVEAAADRCADGHERSP